jgi:RimJ/RimL family protein N-acetyltransferase
MSVARTSRLILRRWSSDAQDVEFLFDMYRREEVMRYIGTRPVPMTTRGEVVDRLERWAAIDDGVRGVRAVTTREGERLGSVLLKHIPWSHDTAESERGDAPDTEIGWHFHPDAWGAGYATEAASAVLAEAQAAGIARIVAVTNPANLASQRVCLRIGLVARGRTRRYYDTECALFETPGASERPVDNAAPFQPV